MIRILLFFLALTSAALAVSDPGEMLPDPAQEARARAVGQQLRCLVCQNNSVEESESDFARDLRRVIRERVKAGDDDAQVMAWMTARYGEYVQLRPPLSPHTVLLWASPVLALLAGGAAVLLSRRRRPAAPVPLSAAEQAAVRKLLEP